VLFVTEKIYDDVNNLKKSQKQETKTIVLLHCVRKINVIPR